MKLPVAAEASVHPACATARRMRWRRTLVAVFIAALPLALTPCTSALAKHAVSQHEALRLYHAGAIVSLQSLVEQAFLRYPGARVLEMELEQHSHGYVYEVELVLPSGMVRKLRWDATSGALLEDKVDD